MTARLRHGVAAALAVAAPFVLIPAVASAATADLGIALTDSPDPVTAETELVYAVEVTNAGPEAATEVAVADDLPSQTRFVSATPSQGSCDRHGGKLSCALGTLESGAAATIEIRLVPRKPGSLVNEATVSSADTDPVPLNDTATETTTVLPAPPAPTCGGHAATVVGTEGDDQLIGTAKRDVIAALGGNDVVDGLEGNDLICGSAGDDTVRGRAGADLLRTGSGRDTVRGGGGPDTLRAGGGRDLLLGGAADDLLRGGGGVDRCVGGSGRDTKRSC